MLSREKSSQEVLHQKLNLLASGGALSVRPYDNNEHLVKNPVIMNGLLIDWNPEMQFPSEEAINAVTVEQIADAEEVARKTDRNSRMANDLSVIAAFDSAKKADDKLEFTAYLDGLEAVQKAMIL